MLVSPGAASRVARVRAIRRAVARMAMLGFLAQGWLAFVKVPAIMYLFL